MKRILLHELGWYPKVMPAGSFARQTTLLSRRQDGCKLRMYRDNNNVHSLYYCEVDDRGYEIPVRQWERAEPLAAQAIIWAFQFDKMEELDAH